MNDDEPDEDYDSHPEMGLTDDVFECRNCGNINQAKATVVTDWVPAPFGAGSIPMRSLNDDLKCQECNSDDLVEFMRKPTNLPSSSDKEQALIDTDPDWSRRFAGDIDRAYKFYFVH